MSIHNNPTNTVKARGRPSKTPGPSDYCRICKASFKITLGNFTRYISTENIYTANKKSSDGSSLSDLISKTLRTPVYTDENLSSRVCSKCALKIRNAAKHADDVHSNINVPHTDFSHAAEAIEAIHSNVRSKRLYNSPRSVQSSCKKRVKLYSSPAGKSDQKSTDHAVAKQDLDCKRSPRRSLEYFLDGDDTDKENENPVLPFAIDGGDFSELFNDKKQQKLEVDVHLNYPSGRRVVHVNDNSSKYLIKNVAQKNWKVAVNIMFKDKEYSDHIHEATRSKVASEFKEYCHSDNSVLKYSSAAEMASYSNKLVKHEAAIYCPLWSSAV